MPDPGPEGSSVLDEYWYYTVEVTPDQRTPGCGFTNVALTRNLLAGIDLTGAYCLDIGTMEGVIPALMAKRAARVVATDAFNCSRKIDLVKRLHGVDFDYHANIQLDDLVSFMDRKWHLERFGGAHRPRRFDVVVVSGILYHVFSPLHLIGYARSLVRPGGLVIFETAALLNPTFTQQYNYRGGGQYIYGWTDTWFLSVPLLDHLIRFCRMAPLDGLYFRQGHPDDLVRIAAVCRAVDDVVADEGETIMKDSTRNFDYSRIVADDPQQERLPDVPYHGGREGLVFRPATGTCDLFASCSAMPAHVPAEDEVILRLGATR